jgi:hypothetical protein
MSSKTQALVVPAPPLTSNLPVIARQISFSQRLWPVVALIIAATVNVTWMGFLGYWLLKLVGPAFF